MVDVIKNTIIGLRPVSLGEVKALNKDQLVDVLQEALEAYDWTYTGGCDVEDEYKLVAADNVSIVTKVLLESIR